MGWSFLAYNVLVSAAGPLVLAATAFQGRLRGNWAQRLGLVPRLGGGRPRIWLHAVSVGEVQVAAALAEALKRKSPGAAVWISTGTHTGRTAALEILPDFPVITFPLDAYGAPGRALARLSPDLVIILETELWPNFLRAAARFGAKIMLANGRISVRSFSGYRRVRFFFRQVLGFIDKMAMISPGDRDRITALGAVPERVLVAGNAKYDLLIEKADRAEVTARQDRLGLSGPVWVAGSTRSGEEPLLLDVYARLKIDFPDLNLILAPRHIQRADRLVNLIRSKGLACVRYSRLPEPPVSGQPVILVDVMGELFYLYGLAEAAFCGGSLVPLGGQNPLEPAVWGVPVLYGPSMEDFLDARDMLESVAAGRSVTGPDDLYRRLHHLLADPQAARAAGRAGQKILAGHQGAAERLADLALALAAMDKSEGTCYQNKG